MTPEVESIVIVGAGQAGARAAEALRSHSYRGAIVMLGDEPHLPYERPQLSKAILQSADARIAYIKDAADWSGALGVNIITGARVVHCDADRRVVATEDGRSFRFDRLLLATGTRPRKLDVLRNAPLNVRYLRNIEDALQVRRSIEERSRIVIVGGGVVGLEAACPAAKQGCRLTVVESQKNLLARAFPDLISDIVMARHRDHGVDFVLGATVTGCTPRGLALDSGVEVEADFVLVGIGVEPDVALTRQLKISDGDGIRVDGYGRTDAPHVYCAGDVALQWSRCHERAVRVETWANAQNQAAVVAANMIGVTRDYTDPPWFWTDQYDLKIQVVGDMMDADHLVRGNPADGGFSIVALRGADVVGALSVNAAKDMAMLRRIVAAGRQPARADLESPAFDLRSALK